MLEICDSVVTELLSILFKNCANCGIFPDIWKMSHIIPTYKKMISAIKTITIQYLFYESAEKYLKELYIITNP